ncbi:MAG: NAD-dependent epimerase/dehydratase family protein [bacterium]|nr:NAD-dependent epimerase/dehydratase family protein [bacterium]
MTQRALVTGANGFVGVILCDQLASRGWELVKGVYGAAEGDDTKACDLANRAEVDELVGWAGAVDHVLHLGAMTFVPDSIQSPAATIAVNVEGTINLIEALRVSGFEGRFVFVGSAGAYGQPRALPVEEDHPLCPINPYDISKAAADQYCAFAYDATGMDIVRTRPFNHSGPGQSTRFVLPAFARQLALIEAGEAPPEFRVGNLEAARDFLHVDDVTAAYEAVALRGKPGEVYNICSGTSRTIREALDGLLALSEADVRVTLDEERLRPVDAPRVVGSHDRLTAHTGWKPEIPFERMLADLLDEWRGRVAQGER